MKDTAPEDQIEVSISSGPKPQRDIYDLINMIQEAFAKWDIKAIEGQKKSKSYVVVSAVLIPIAVLFLTIQILAFPDPGPVSLNRSDP